MQVPETLPLRIDRTSKVAAVLCAELHILRTVLQIYEDRYSSTRPSEALRLPTTGRCCFIVTAVELSLQTFQTFGSFEQFISKTLYFALSWMFFSWVPLQNALDVCVFVWASEH